MSSIVTGSGGALALHHHAQRVADQQHVDARALSSAREAGVVGGDHRQVGCLRACAVRGSATVISAAGSAAGSAQLGWVTAGRAITGRHEPGSRLSADAARRRVRPAAARQQSHQPCPWPGNFRSGGDVRQRHQHEGALVQARMRQGQPGSRRRARRRSSRSRSRVRGPQRSLSRAARPAPAPASQQAIEQSRRRVEAAIQFGDGIRHSPAAATAPRRRAVACGARSHATTGDAIAQCRARARTLRGRVAEVAAETDIGACADASPVQRHRQARPAQPRRDCDGDGAACARLGPSSASPAAGCLARPAPVLRRGRVHQPASSFVARSSASARSTGNRRRRGSADGPAGARRACRSPLQARLQRPDLAHRQGEAPGHGDRRGCSRTTRSAARLPRLHGSTPLARQARIVALRGRPQQDGEQEGRA